MSCREYPSAGNNSRRASKAQVFTALLLAVVQMQGGHPRQVGGIWHDVSVDDLYTVGVEERIMCLMCFLYYVCIYYMIGIVWCQSVIIKKTAN
jgi:hypothetical protein